MTIETLISAILPSLCVSLIMLFFNQQQAQRDKKNSEREIQQKKSEKMQVSLLVATAKLSYAVAIAMKNGHPNGEVEDGIEEYKEAMKAFKQLERELVAEQSLNT